MRTNLTDAEPVQLRNFYLQLVPVEEAFKNLKSDLALRPIYHQLDHRMEAHVFLPSWRTAYTSHLADACMNWRRG